MDKDENFNLKNFEKDKSTLMRDGYIYERYLPYKRAKMRVMTAQYH